MNTTYLIRLDDASPFMDCRKWQRIEDMLDRFHIRPLVGIIPANIDPDTIIEPEDPQFWDKARRWKQKGWSIALHGYDHVYVTDDGMKGMNPFWRRSEFVGLPLEAQREKIGKGYSILKEHGVEPRYFYATSHTFDEYTLEALRAETDIRVISDTIALKPYAHKGFVFVPQIFGHCVKMPVRGVFTFCFHPNEMDDGAFARLESFLEKHHQAFMSFDEIDVSKVTKASMADLMVRKCFFAYRKLRGIAD